MFGCVAEARVTTWSYGIGFPDWFNTRQLGEFTSYPQLWITLCVTIFTFDKVF